MMQHIGNNFPRKRKFQSMKILAGSEIASNLQMAEYEQKVQLTTYRMPIIKNQMMTTFQPMTLFKAGNAYPPF
jgi:hypothetical protein